MIKFKRAQFEATFKTHTEAVEWGHLNGWKLQGTEPRENGGVRAWFLA